jgi:DNA-binding HxlR family transcriptional regulator
VRAGTRILPMAANSIKRGILRELLDRPLRMGPGREFRITPGGREMLFVAFVTERWLQSAPSGPLHFDGEGAEAAVAALVDGWSSTVMHALAREPMTLPELDRAVDDLNRRTLKRRLTAMQHAGQVEARPSDGEGAIYSVTDWLRAGIAPLTAAARLERRDPHDDMVPIAALDVEAAFLLTLPLLELPAELSGSCRLGVEIDDGEPCLAGATARVEAGRVTSCAVRLEEEADAWAIASAGDWLDTVIEPDAKRVKTGGDRLLASALLDRLHGTLFGIPVR